MISKFFLQFQAILGQRIVRPANFDRTINELLLKCSKETLNFSVISGNTMAAECFYEGLKNITPFLITYQA